MDLIDYEPYYGDVSELNTSRLIMDSVRKETLKEIAEDAIDLLGTSMESRFMLGTALLALSILDMGILQRKQTD